MKSEPGLFAKIASKIIRLLMQPGRFVFPKGSKKVDKTTDSFSMEYLYLVQERARLEATTIPPHYRKNIMLSIILLPLILLRFVFLFIRLAIVTEIIRSYLNSHQIKSLMLKQNENSHS